MDAKHVGCFANSGSPSSSIHTGSIEKESTFCHLEGATYAFYTRSPLLEQAYTTLFLAEPDMTPAQPGWFAPLIEESKRVKLRRRRPVAARLRPPRNDGNKEALRKKQAERFQCPNFAVCKVDCSFGNRMRSTKSHLLNFVKCRQSKAVEESKLACLFKDKEFCQAVTDRGEVMLEEKQERVNLATPIFCDLSDQDSEEEEESSGMAVVFFDNEETVDDANIKTAPFFFRPGGW